MNHNALTEVLKASQLWIEHFNKGDVDYCVAGYTPDAEIKAAPMGEYKGTAEIDSFWRPFMQSGASNLNYKNIWIKQVDENIVHLGADWSMNVGLGIITLEEWIKQIDGKWHLKRDHFEIKEQFKK
jgi:ketosteroid isomerase-like protein